MAANQRFIDMMVNQPNNGLMRKFTRLGVSLLLHLHGEIAEIESSAEMALEKLINLQGKKSALRAAGILPDLEQENEWRQQVDELKEKLFSYYKLLADFAHVQGLPRPGIVELASFKGSLQHQVFFDIEETPWENEHDLVHIYPISPEPLDGLSNFIILKIFKHSKSPRFQAFLKWLPTCISRHLILPGWEMGSPKPVPLLIKPEALRGFVRSLATFIAPTITVLPMFVLYAISSTWIRMAVVWGFSLAFARAVVHLSNEANPHSIFSTNAAFCAVLAVFVGSAPV